jgi:23S rRNA (adenine1618-N6)-methyltransferase
LTIVDIDDKSLQFARMNIQENSLQNRIKLAQTQSLGPLIPLDTLGFERYFYKDGFWGLINESYSIDFSMCNPPFYESKAEMIASAASKQRPPFTACTGSENEMVTPGGEVAFVSRMIEESIILQGRVQWYTSMLGKYSSVAPIVKKLRENKVENYAVTEFVQGSKTRRWGIAWSFEALRPTMDISRGANASLKGSMPFPSEYAIVVIICTQQISFLFTNELAPYRFRYSKDGPSCE